MSVERIFIENRIVVPLDRMPPLLPKALCLQQRTAVFFEHPGLDFLFRVGGHFFNNLRKGKKKPGRPQRFTQQVAKGLLLTPEKDLSEKNSRRQILAYRIDTLLSKDENHLHLLESDFISGDGGPWAFEAAALTYFNKHALQTESGGGLPFWQGLPQAPEPLFTRGNTGTGARVRQKIRPQSNGGQMAISAREAGESGLCGWGSSGRVRAAGAGRPTAIICRK